MNTGLSIRYIFAALVLAIVLAAGSPGPVRAQDVGKTPEEGPGLFTRVVGGTWSGIKSVVTPGSIFSSEDDPAPIQTYAKDRGPQKYDSSESSMSRMMGRMSNVMSSGRVEEDEFGLPKWIGP